MLLHRRDYAHPSSLFQLMLTFVDPPTNICCYASENPYSSSWLESNMTVVGETSDKNQNCVRMSQHATKPEPYLHQPVLTNSTGFWLSSALTPPPPPICHDLSWIWRLAFCWEAAVHIISRQQRNQPFPSPSGEDVKHWREPLPTVTTVFIHESEGEMKWTFSDTSASMELSSW